MELYLKASSFLRLFRFNYFWRECKEEIVWYSFVYNDFNFRSSGSKIM